MKIKLTILSLILFLCLGAFAACDSNSECKHNFKDGICTICDFVKVTRVESFEYAIQDGEATITKFIGEEKHVKIPDTIEGNPVTVIGGNAFRSNQELIHFLQSVTLGKNIKTIEYQAFYGCLELLSIDLSAAKNLTSIGDYAFGLNEKLQSIDLPNSVETIGGRAFYFNKSIESIRIPALLTSIGSEAFSGCEKLSVIEVDENNPVYRGEGNAIITKAEHILVVGCSATIIADSVNAIGEGAFSNCTALTEIKLPNSIVWIDRYAFSNCTALTEIKLPNSVMFMGENAFSDCTALAEIELSSSIMSISASVFNNCKKLAKIELPNSIKSIGKNAFSGCTALTEIKLPNSIKSIDSYAFNNCTGLTKIELPNSITAIASYTFFNCKKLTKIELPNSVIRIGDFAFASSGLVEITIPNSVESLGSNVFFGCAVLKNVTIGDGIGELESNVFGYCMQIETILIGSGVTNIAYGAFTFSGDSIKVYFKGESPSDWYEIGGEVLTGCIIYYYSEQGVGESGLYWSYDEEGRVVEWNVDIE